MKHDAMIAPDESQFVFTPKISGYAANDGETGSITVPDAHLLFNGEFKRAGDDLKIIGDDGNAFVVTDYFTHDRRPTLLSPEGASILGDVVDMLAGPLAPGQYAQAGTQQGTAEAVGRVAVVTGNVTVLRNGVAITVNAGDAILKNDVVQTGAGATCGIAFNDGSTFNIAGGARLAINEFVYDPNGAGNASLVTLIQGAATFVAGQVAKTGDMKVATPVATMGIRGTAVILDINANDGRVTISVIDQRDNQTHNVEVFDRAGNLVATATSIGGRLILTPTATLDVIASFTNKTPELVAMEFAAFQAVLSSYDAAKQFFPNLPDHTDATPKSTQHAEGTTIQPSTGGSKLSDFSSSGDKVVVQQVVITTPASTTGSDGTGGGADSNPLTLDEGQPTTTTTVTIIYGTPGHDGTDGTDGSDGSNGSVLPSLTGTPGPDIIYAGEGNDIIIGGHGGGNDHYDGGGGFDLLTFPSADSSQPLVWHLRGILADNNTVEGPLTGHDTFTNIEWLRSGAGDDVFHLYNEDHWIIDGRGGFDIIRVMDGLDFTGEDEGPDIHDIEMIDLDDGEVNIIDFDGQGVADVNGAGVLRIIGNTGDVINLNGDDAPGHHGHWVLVGGPKSDDDLFAEDGYTDGVTFKQYNFVERDGDVTSTAYIDKDIAVTIQVVDPEATADIDSVREAGVSSSGDPFAVGNVLANDSSPNDDDLTVTGGLGFVQGTYGFLILLSGGGYLYTLNNSDPHTQALAQGAQASDIFTYTMADGAGLTATSTLTIQVTGANDAPEIEWSPGTAVTSVNTPLAISGMQFDDVDTGDLFTFTVKVHHGSIELEFDPEDFDLIPVWIAGPSTNLPYQYAFKGTLANINDALEAGFIYTPESDYAGASDLEFTVTDSHGASDSQTLDIAINSKPVINAPDRIDYWTNSGSGNVTAINHLSFSDIGAGNNPVTVTLRLDPSDGTLNAANISGDGVSVSGSGSRTVTLTGSIASINAYLAGNNVLFDPPGSSLADRNLHVTINDGGINGSGAQSASADITLNSVSYSFTNGDDSVDLHNVNLDGISLIDMRGGGNVLVTSWNHLDVSATTYDGNDTGNPDTVTLVFSPEQLLEIMSSSSNRSELQSYLDGNPGSGSSADTLSLGGTDWNASVSGFETAWLALAAGDDYITYNAIGDDLPNFMSGRNGDAGDNTLVATGSGQTPLNGNNGNDILVAHSSGSTLNGGSGADLLLGAAGSDVLQGGSGNDILAGNAGADTFIFRANMGHDTVIDFTPGIDKLDLGQSNYTIEAITGGDLLIHLSVDEDILLKNVQLGQLTANDFIIPAVV